MMAKCDGSLFDKPTHHARMVPHSLSGRYCTVPDALFCACVIMRRERREAARQRASIGRRAVKHQLFINAFTACFALLSL